MSSESTAPSFLRRVPNTVFSVALALGSHAILWQKVASDLCDGGGLTGIFRVLNYFFWAASLFILLFVGMLYLLKIYFHYDITLAEWRDPVRSNFNMAPGICVILLTLGVPRDLFDNMHPDSMTALTMYYRIGFFIGLAFQVLMVQLFYQRWMGVETQQLKAASTPYLLTVINWFLLSLLGCKAEILECTGLDLPPMLFGVGCFFAAVIYSNIFQRMHEGTPIARGHPAMFLVLAPLSVASQAIAAMNDGVFGGVSRGIFGLAIILFLCLLSSGPQLLRKPAFPGIYWAYVFPLAALACAAIMYASTEGSRSARFVAWMFVAIAAIGLILVFCRMFHHQVQFMRGLSTLEDPLQKKFDNNKAAGAEEVNSSCSRDASARGGSMRCR